jgi:hypothetical protein
MARAARCGELLAVVAFFFGALDLANAAMPLIVDRYLIAGAGAVTVAIAILAASSEAPVWLPAIASAFARFLQGQTLRYNLNFPDHGWMSSARAVAQFVSECPSSRVFAYPAYNHTHGLNDPAIALRINRFSYGYYAKKFQFAYEDLSSGSTVAASGQCPSIIWIEHMMIYAETPNPNVERVLNDFPPEPKKKSLSG